MEDKTIVHTYNEGGIEIYIEMPISNQDKEKAIIQDIKHIMNNELLLQLNN